ncbi:MAG: hypothetical protein J6K39_01780 [Clostridia bacterium]|nr:hypothetical protein [Clostridia bacterium]
MEEKTLDLKKLMFLKKVYAKNLCNNIDDSSFTSAYALFVDAIDTHNFTSQQELSDFLCCNKAHTSRMVLKMQLGGLLKPAPKTISLTEKGKCYAKSVRESKCQLMSFLFQNISTNDKQIFVKVLNQILTNANAIDEVRG